MCLFFKIKKGTIGCSMRNYLIVEFKLSPLECCKLSTIYSSVGVRASGHQIFNLNIYRSRPLLNRPISARQNWKVYYFIPLLNRKKIKNDIHVKQNPNSNLAKNAKTRNILQKL
ncbi:hypothetical protein BpHYR1_003457 [Brachionus plicatilis]|uniref:Uncharacterized protein n=1 Tax=Brachionus plicatilis TaxID=10195 RepID=A0A3M7TB23_BRAPC|nr:hypothetical protein BpHYR1_003457 [Brachionus plicatilis]